jgi:hypothetical protein
MAEEFALAAENAILDRFGHDIAMHKDVPVFTASPRFDASSLLLRQLTMR